MIDAVMEQIEIEASSEVVFEAWTTPAQLIEWWSGEGICVKKWTMDLRVGGKWRSEGTKAQGEEFVLEGEYLRIDPPKFLSFTWQKPSWVEDGSQVATTVEIEFHKTTKGTLLKLKHSGFTNQELRDDHKRGWTRVLGWSGRYAENKSLSKSA